MKGKTQNKPSKASLVARGLATKPRTVPTKNKSIRQKKKTVPESKPGYALYSTDSEADQVSHVRQGLDRCANLLSNILDGEPGKSSIKPSARGKNPKFVPSVKPRKLNAVSTGRPASQNNTVPQGMQPSQSKTPVVIPTGRNGHNEVSPSPSRLVASLPHSRPVDSSTTARAATVYNDRLTASTPVLDTEQRRKQQELIKREEQLQQQLQQLKQHYELLQQQRSPEHQQEQKRRLQNSMLHQLNGYEDSETGQCELTARRPVSHTNEVDTVLGSGTQLLSNSQRPTVRRSLDYAVTTPSQEQIRGDSMVQLGGSAAELPAQDLGPLATKVKQVRIVSPTNDNGYPTFQGQPPYTTQPQGTTLGSASQVTNTASGAPMPSLPMTLSSSPVSRPRSAPPRANQNVAQPAENQIRTLQYLIGELRSLLGSAGDLEVDRLLLEIDHVSSLLPLVLDKQAAQPAESIDMDLALQPLRLENSQLRRKLRITNQKVKDQENALKNLDGKPGVSTEVAFETCKSVNKVLQDQLKEERESKEKILRTNESLSKSVSDLQEEKRKLLHLLSEKDQDYLKSKQGWQKETSKACVGTKHMRAELQAAELASEAAKKENRILTFTLKQKDKEIERLKELSRSSQQSLSKLLSSMQQFQPNAPVEGTGILQGKATALGKLDKLLSIDNHARRTLTSVAVNGNSEDFIEERNSPGTRTKKAIRFSSPRYEEDAYLSPGGRGTGDSILRSPRLSPGRDLLDVRYGNQSYTSDDLSSVSSKEEVEFKQDLAHLDANIARLQRNLREALTRN